MRLWAIKSNGCDMYVNNNCGLSNLDRNTMFFSSKEKAYNEIIKDDAIIFNTYNPILVKIALKHIADLRNTHPLELDVSQREIRKTLIDLDLAVVPINLSESKAKIK